MYTVYILYSQDLDCYYIGYTSQKPDIRLQKHLAKHSGFTSKAKDWVVVYTEEYETKEIAMKREKMIKKWKSKSKIEQLISSTK